MTKEEENWANYSVYKVTDSLGRITTGIRCSKRVDSQQTEAEFHDRFIACFGEYWTKNGWWRDGKLEGNSL